MVSFLVLLAFSLMASFPLWMLISGSLMGEAELKECIGTVLGMGEGYAKWHALPQYPTLRPLLRLFFDSPKFFVMFWNSCIQVLPGIVGQLIIALPAAWSFARFRFRGREALFVLYIVLMILPFQVTMVSSYLILNRLGLVNTHFSLILPMVFSTFPVFIMEKCFKAIPHAIIEAAKVDGAGELAVFLHIGLPMGTPGMISAFILGFLEGWNAVEQPITFLKDQSLWPLSLYLPEIASQKLAVAMAAAMITMVPAILLFLLGQEYIEEGIIASGVKE
jgi:multiple sugar transport system permease protein